MFPTLKTPVGTKTAIKSENHWAVEYYSSLKTKPGVRSKFPSQRTDWSQWDCFSVKMTSPRSRADEQCVLIQSWGKEQLSLAPAPETAPHFYTSVCFCFTPTPSWKKWARVSASNEGSIKKCIAVKHSGRSLASISDGWVHEKCIHYCFTIFMTQRRVLSWCFCRNIFLMDFKWQ